MDIDKPKYYENIVDIAPIGILTFDYEEKILVINQHMAFYLKKTPKELEGKNVKLVLSELNPEILILIDAVKNRTSVFEEYYPMKIGNENMFFNIKGVVLPEQGLLIFENVSSIKSYQDNLRSLDKSKDEFISIASHDLRTPLTAIRGYLDIVLKEEVGVISTPKMKEYLEYSRQGALRLNDLVEDMLSVSRIDQKRMKFSFEEMELNPLIQTMISELTPQANARSLYLKYEAPTGKLPKVQIDKIRFQEVLGNLITNAIKFTESGGVTIRVLTREDHVRIDCIDTGIGIPQEKQKDIFKKFFQLNSSTSSQQKGTGLGLYISKMITEKMGGRIVVNSASGKGTNVFFTVPIAKTALAKRAEDEIKQELLANPNQK